jgi:hypothetical protein
MGKAEIAEPEYGTFTDGRDGRTYKTVKMPDGKVWMAQNLILPGHILLQRRRARELRRQELRLLGAVRRRPPMMYITT